MFRVQLDTTISEVLPDYPWCARIHIHTLRTQGSLTYISPRFNTQRVYFPCKRQVSNYSVRVALSVESQAATSFYKTNN